MGGEGGVEVGTPPLEPLAYAHAEQQCVRPHTEADNISAAPSTEDLDGRTG